MSHTNCKLMTQDILENQTLVSQLYDDGDGDDDDDGDGDGDDETCLCHTDVFIVS